MNKYDKYLRPLTEDEAMAIETVISNINQNPGSVIEVEIDTLNPRLTGFIIELIKQVKAKCRKISGCNVYEDKIVFNEKRQKNKPKKAQC